MFVRLACICGDLSSRNRNPNRGHCQRIPCVTPKITIHLMAGGDAGGLVYNRAELFTLADSTDVAWIHLKYVDGHLVLSAQRYGG